MYRFQLFLVNYYYYYLHCLGLLWLLILCFPCSSVKMPRYDDRYGSKTRLYVGRLSTRTRSRDLERLFSRYGR